jgi:hypothetical protein
LQRDKITKVVDDRQEEIVVTYYKGSSPLRSCAKQRARPPKKNVMKRRP